MAIKSKLDTAVETAEEEVLYTVTVEQEVGVVVDDNLGDFPPLKVAFMMVADYFAENARSESNSFDFAIKPAHGNPIVVAIQD